MRNRQYTKIVNIIGILVGFGLGQGTLFAISSFLIVNGKLSLVGELGLVFGTLSLIIWIIDFGGIYYLTHLVVTSKVEDTAQVILGRLCFAIIVSFIVIIFYIYFPSLTFEFKTVALGVAFVGPVWAFNILGLIEAKGYAGVAGLFNNINILLASLYVSVSVINDLKIYPEFFALTYMAGTVFTVICQYYFASKYLAIFANMKISYIPEYKKIKHFISFGSGIALSQLPGQTYPRILIWLVNLQLGTNVGGIFVYLKNINNIIAQIITAIRRVEYRELLISVNSNNHTYLKLIWMQKLGIYFSTLVFIASIFIFQYYNNETFEELTVYFPAYLLIIIFWTFASAGGQCLIAQGKSYAYAIINSIFVLCAVFGCWILLDYWNLWTIPIIEIIMHFCQFIIYGYFIKIDSNRII